MFGRFKKDKTPTLEDVANAAIGSSVSLGDGAARILGTLILEEDGDRWIEHMVQRADGSVRWISIENFDTTLATQWNDADPLAINGGPDDRRITYRGVSYKRVEHGTVVYTSAGEVDVPAGGTIDYVDFRADDGSRIGFERFGSEGAGRRSSVISGGCPKCGAPLHLDATGKCSSCGSELMTDVGWWGSWEVSIGEDITSTLRLA